jgi:uncharacterized coiled-coil DUF342 family protein
MKTLPLLNFNNRLAIFTNFFMALQHVVNFAATWMNFEEYESTDPEPETELRARVAELENKVGAQDLIVAAQNIELSEAQRQRETYKKHARECEETLHASLENAEVLTRDIGSLKAELETSRTHLAASQAARASLASELQTAQVKEKKTLAENARVIAERDEALSEREDARRQLKELRVQCDGLRQKLKAFKAKVTRLSEQLSLVPWLRNSSWSVGFNWGFENFRTLALNASQYKNISIRTVSVNFLRIPAEGMASLGRLGVEYFPDVLDWSEHAPRPRMSAEPAEAAPRAGDEDPQVRHPGEPNP